MNYLFTSESVSEGHPDKVADQISDAVLDQFLAQDPNSKVACETLVTTGQVVIAGEVKSDAYIDLGATAREVINSIGYNRSELKFDGESCGIFSALHEQSSDINRGVEQAVIDAIPFDRAAPVSELLEKTGLAVADLLPILLALQMKKAAEELPGGYIRCAAAFSAL